MSSTRQIGPRRGVVKLRPRASIIKILGDELISDDAVALTELVKNSYDADATEVRVLFDGRIEEPDQGTLAVADNGVGMSLDAVLTAWLEPATNIKKQAGSKRTARGRRVLGEKGIGRFAAGRLSSHLEMVTRESGSPFEVTVRFDWKNYDMDVYLDEVETSWEQREPVEIADHGTVLRLSRLKARWDTGKLENLAGALSRLLSPFHKKENFQIVLDLAPSYAHLGGEIRPSELLSRPNYVIKGTVNAEGSCDLAYSHEKEDERIQGSLFKRQRSPECGPFELEMRVWDRDPLGIQRLAQLFERKQSEIREELNRSAGVYIYRDKFRVLSYGEPETDWLRLDHRRILNPTLRVSNNQVVGCILISADKNPALRDQTNREGVIASGAFEDLKVLARNALSLLEERRYKARPRESVERRRERTGVFSGLTLAPVQAALQRNYPRDKATLALVRKQEQQLEESIRVVQEVLARYRRLATLGQLVDIILHDGRTPLNKIASEAQLGEKDVGRITLTRDARKKLGGRFGFIGSQSAVLSRLFKKIEPFSGRKRGRPKKVIMEDIINDAFELEAKRLARLGVDYSIADTKTFVTVDPVELQLAFWNLLDNSLYWLEQTSETKKRRITVDLGRNKQGELEILFCDNGPGVNESDREFIFDPYFSTKPDGIGLGLSIAGETVAEYNGELELVRGTLSGACFRVTLRRRV